MATPETEELFPKLLPQLLVANQDISIYEKFFLESRKDKEEMRCVFLPRLMNIFIKNMSSSY